MESIKPDVVAPSSLSTANTYLTLRVTELAKKIDPGIITLAGGQHFTALPEESLNEYPELDIIVRGEGERTLTEVIQALEGKIKLSEVRGISYRVGGEIRHNPPRPLIPYLDQLPYPAYHLVKEHIEDYYFALMAEEDTPFAIVEGSRGCRHNCSYCSQWSFWKSRHRAKSPERVVDEMEYLNETYGSSFYWLTDDNLGMGERTQKMCQELIDRDLDVTWFSQLRCDDIVRQSHIIPYLREAGCIWLLLGLDSPREEVLSSWHRREITRDSAKKAVDILRENSIFSQGTFIIGHRTDSHESIKDVRRYADWIDPDIATFMTLTPYPGTEVYNEAEEKGLIEDWNWSHYDMIHAIMPTEHLTRTQVQEELYRCYNEFFGSWSRRYRGLRSDNPITKRTYLYLAKQAILTGVKQIISV